MHEIWMRIKNRVLPLLAAVLAVAAVVSVANVQPGLCIELGETVSATDFRVFPWGSFVFADGSTQMTPQKPEKYPVELKWGALTYDTQLLVEDTCPPEADVQDLVRPSVRMPEPGDFVVQIRDLSEVTVAFGTEPDATKEGIQQVSLLFTDEGGNVTELTANLEIYFDTTPPEIHNVEDVTYYVGLEFDAMAGVSVTDDKDAAPELTVDSSRMDLAAEGIYTIFYHAKDESGNEATYERKITVIHDTQPPQLLGVTALSIYQGSTVTYRKGVIVRDDYDTAPVLSIDSSGVDLSQPGTYPVVYRAVDAAGNESAMETTITVKTAPSYYVPEADIFALADNVLDYIIDEDMTDEEKVWAVYYWMRWYCNYQDYADKSDRLQAAYSMMLYGRGNCYSYHALSTLLFDRLGIPYLTVTRAPSVYRSTRHYWSLVSVDGGETYYHFDATPCVGWSTYTCLKTDDQMLYLNRFLKGYYNWDTSLYPATPTQAP